MRKSRMNRHEIERNESCLKRENKRRERTEEDGRKASIQRRKEKELRRMLDIWKWKGVKLDNP